MYCQSTNATVSNCIIVSNFCTIYGAGAYSGTLSGCQINYNAVICGGSAGGGAVAFSRVTDSTINNNSFIGGGGELGGGAYSCILSNCAIDENLRGGVFRSSLDHCTVANNTNGLGGGGAMMSVLNVCLVSGNQSSSWGGGVYDCTLNSCTLSNNWSATRGGAAYYDFFQTNAPLSEADHSPEGAPRFILERHLITFNATLSATPRAGTGAGVTVRPPIRAPTAILLVIPH